MLHIQIAHNVFDVSGTAGLGRCSSTFRLLDLEVNSGIVSHSYDPCQSPDCLSCRAASSDQKTHICRVNFYGKQNTEFIDSPDNLNGIGIVNNFLDDYLYEISISVL